MSRPRKPHPKPLGEWPDWYDPADDDEDFDEDEDEDDEL